MFHTCRPSVVFGPVGAQVTQIRQKWHIVKRHFLHVLQNMLGYFYPEFSGWITMLLLTGHLTGMAPGAIVIFDKQSIFRHLPFPPLLSKWFNVSEFLQLIYSSIPIFQ
jgi:hypothetical protein